VTRTSVIASLAAVGAAVACRAVDAAVVDASDAAYPSTDDGALDAEAFAIDAHDEVVSAARAALDAGLYDGGYIGAASMQTSVLSHMEWPDADGGQKEAGVVRLGYLRYGAKVAAFTEPFANDDCREGWYELVSGGYVCGKYATFDLKDPRVRLAPAPPNLAAPMPYRYGYSLAHGTPLYRRVLSIEDRKKYEPWLVPPPAVEKKDDVASDENAEPAPSASASAPPPMPDASVPWFMRERDGGRPSVTLDDLHGRGVLVRRMMRGFYLALDRDFRAAHARWWRTTAGFAVPYERVGLQPAASDFHGSWIPYTDGSAEPNGSAALITSSFAVKYSVDLEKKKVTWTAPAPRLTAVALSGDPVLIGGVEYQATAHGFWIRLLDAMIVAAPELPQGGPANEKWIDVDVTRQLLVAFEGARPVYMTLISSGRRNPNDPEKDYPTPPGAYRIREKHVTAMMDGDVAADGLYSIEDVPWVMYFQGSYALHAAFWHTSFGHTRSHGCVNMSPIDAREIFLWSEPHLPAGWHGVYATEASPGTRVVVHEQPQKKR